MVLITVNGYHMQCSQFTCFNILQVSYIVSKLDAEPYIDPLRKDPPYKIESGTKWYEGIGSNLQSNR